MIPLPGHHRPGGRRAARIVSAFIAVAAVCGCMTKEEWDRLFDSSRGKSQPAPTPWEGPNTKALDGAVAPLVTVEGLRYNQVRGFGLVVGLVDSGGSDAPKVVKDHIAKEMQRHQQPDDPTLPTEDILKDPDSAIVEVTGYIPAAAEKGTRFDVYVRAMGSQTKSLIGGRLVLCKLALFAETLSGVVAGKTLASADGPIFVSPFGREQTAATRIDPREGMVLGGGVVTEPRRVRLVLSDPSYSVASRIRDRINGRYGAITPIADAQSPSFVEITIPNEHRDRKKWFLDLILHTTLNGNQQFLEQRAGELSSEITHPDAAYETIAMAWEAIGQTALPSLQPLYHHALREASFYAARTGLRLGDVDAVEIVATHAFDARSPLREQAIEELARAEKMHRAGEHLRKLLDDEDVQIRIRAYRGLRHHHHPAITTERLDEDNVILDVVDSGGPFLVYAQRSEEPRLALFGKNLRCQPPALYPEATREGWSGLVQITAKAGDDHLTLIYKNRRNGAQSPPLPLPLEAAALVRFLGGRPDLSPEGNVEGLAVPYSEVLDIVYHLCKAGTIPAVFEIERPQAGDVPGVRGRRERDE